MSSSRPPQNPGKDKKPSVSSSSSSTSSSATRPILPSLTPQPQSPMSMSMSADVKRRKIVPAGYGGYSPMPTPTPQQYPAILPNSNSRQRPIAPAQSIGSNMGIDPATGDRFLHGPTNLPPEPYHGESPFRVKPRTQNIHMTAANRLPRLEQRIGQLEGMVDRYVDRRSGQALENATVPGMNMSPMAPSFSQSPSPAPSNYSQGFSSGSSSTSSSSSSSSRGRSSH